MLKVCKVALWDEYDVALLDLDGVVYVGADAVAGAPEHLDRAAKAGMHLAYVTNNAARTPSMVAEHLRELGVPARDCDVVSSAQAAAHLLAAQLEPGSAVFVIGGTGLFEALAEQGLRPVQTIAADPVAVVSGFHPELRWKTVIDGAILVERGLPWVASNTDLTVPTSAGLGPGNGVLVDAVARFAGRDPVVAGKPQPPLFEETMRRVAGEHPLVVGDRLDTDIEGAVATGLDSLLVMTGVTGITDLVRARPGHRPSYICGDLSGLGEPQPVPVAHDGGFELHGWRGVVVDGALVVDGAGDQDDWWRLVTMTAWEHLDTTGKPVDVSGASPPGTVGRARVLDADRHVHEDGDRQ